jgi:hypothetical protein
MKPMMTNLMTVNLKLKLQNRLLQKVNPMEILVMMELHLIRRVS